MILTLPGHAHAHALLVAAVTALISCTRVDHTHLSTLTHVGGVLLQAAPEKLLQHTK